MKWPNGKWPYLFMTFVVLIITQLVAPDTATWIRDTIVELTSIVVNAVRNLGE